MSTSTQDEEGLKDLEPEKEPDSSCNKECPETNNEGSPYSLSSASSSLIPYSRSPFRACPNSRVLALPLEFRIQLVLAEGGGRDW